MVAHGLPLHLAKRDATTTLSIDSTAAVTNTVIAPTDSLAYDGSVSTSSVPAPALVTTSGGTIVVTTTPTPTDSATSSTSTPTAVAAASTSKPLALSTVIGSCVAAFIGASALIVLGIWYYRRYSQSLQKRVKKRGPLARSTPGEERRRRSRHEPWNKLEEGEDKWEGMYQTKESKDVDQVAPMEKLGMFKKTPSVRTAYTHKSADVSAFDFPKSYADFDPNLAQTLTSSQTNLAQSRAQDTPTSSWESDEVASKSYLSVRAMPGGGAMSPTLHMAIPTPPLTISESHKWESAEVVHYADTKPADAETGTTISYLADSDSRQSSHNPFFNARDGEDRGRSPANSGTKSPKAMGKQKMRYSDDVDPFDDTNSKLPKPLYFTQHAPTSSTASTESKEKAIQSLIAALEISEDDARDRLRIASMQPSVISQISSAGGYDEDVSKEFPLPPRNGASSYQP